MPYIGKNPVGGGFHKLDSLTASATDTYALTLGSAAYFPETANQLLVSLNGVIQAPQDSFTVSGSNLVFDTALTTADSIDFVVALGDVLAVKTVTDGAITANKIGTDAVTTAKIQDGAVTNAKINAMAATKLTGHRTSSNIILFSGVGYNSTQAISTTSTTGLFDDVTLSGSSYFSNVVANYNNMVDEDSETARFTPPEDGYYFINYQVAFNGGNNNLYNGLHLFKNTTQHTKAFNNNSHSSNGYSSAVITAVLDLTTSDYVDFKREIHQSTNLTSNGTSIVIYKMF